MSTSSFSIIIKGLLDTRFLEQVKPLRPKRHLPPRRISVKQQDIDALLAQCQKPMDFLLVSLLSSTGLRVSEAAALRLQDIDLDNQTLTVKMAKWGKSRRVGLSLKLVRVIREYLTHRPQNLGHDYLLA